MLKPLFVFCKLSYFCIVGSRARCRDCFICSLVTRGRRSRVVLLWQLWIFWCSSLDIWPWLSV